MLLFFDDAVLLREREEKVLRLVSEFVCEKRN